MGRNSKKNKGRKPAAPEQGLKGAASLASSSANVATTPSRPARTAKHKIRKFPSQSTTAPSTQATDSRTASGLKETQPSLAPNIVNQETPPLGPSTTGTCKSLPTSTAILTESAVTVGSSKEKEIALPQPITTNLSDSYDSSSASSSETETGMQDVVGYIPNTDNVAEMQTIEQKVTMQQTQTVSILQQGHKNLKGLIAEEHASTLLVATESTDVPQRADSIGHSSGIVAIPDVTEPVTPLLHDKPEAKVSELLKGSASRAQAEGNTSFEERARKNNNSLLQGSHPIKHDEVPEVLSSCFETETSKQTAGDDTSSGPVVGRKEDSKLNAKTDVREQSGSGSETTVIDVLVTSCTSADNLKQKNDKEQELKQSFDEQLEEHKHQTSAKKINEPANFTEDIENIRNTSAYQTPPSAAAYNSVEEPLKRNDLQNDTTEETRQTNLYCMEEAPPCSIQESTSSNVDNQQDKRNAQGPLVNVLQQLEREISGLGISKMMIQKNAVQATDSNLALESEQGQAPIVKEQQLHAEVEQEYEPGVLNRTSSGTIDNERRTIGQELPPLTVEKESTASTHGTRPVSPADIITEAEQDLQESHAVEVSTSLNAANEAQETYKENSSVSQILEHQEDVHVKLEAQTVVPEEEATSEKHDLLNSEQYIVELVEPEVKVPTSECQEKAAQSYMGSTYEKHTTNSEVKKDEVAETEVDNLELKEKKECHHDEQPDQLDRGTVLKGHATNSVRSQMEKIECIELKINSALVNQEECQDAKPDQANSSSICEEHKTTDTLENDEKPAVGEPQIQNVTLGSDSVCKEHTRSSENAIEELEVDKSEEVMVFEEEKEFEELSQIKDTRKPAEKKPELKELELKKASLQEKEFQDKMPDQVDTGYVCKEETHCVGLQLENELEVDNVALPKEKGGQENKPDQLDSSAACEGHATNIVESDMDKLQVGEPDIKDIILDKEDYLQEKPNHDQGRSISQEHKKTDSLEEATEKLDMREHLVGGITLHEDQKCNDNDPYQQLDKGEPNSVGNRLEKEREVDNVALHEEKESQEHKPEHLHSNVACEDKATNSLESEMDKLQVGEPEMEDISLDKDDYLQGKPCHATGASVFQEYKTRDSPESAMEELDMGEPPEEGVTLHEDQKSKEDEPNQQLERGIAGQEKPIEIEMEKLEVRQPEVKDTMLDKDQCLQEKTGHDYCGSVCQEDKTTESLEYDVMDKFDPGEPLVGGDRDQECHEEKFDQQLDGDTVCEEHATNSIESEMEKLAVRESQADVITLNNAKSQEEKHDQAHGGSVWEEHKTKDCLENVEKDSHMDDVILDEDQAYQEEKPDQIDRDTVYQDHIKCSENKKEKLDVKELGVATVIEERECQERHSMRYLEEEMEQSMPEVESATFEEKKDSTQRTPGLVDSGYVDEEHEMHSTENQLEKPEAGEPEIEGVALHKETESQEEEFEQLERGIVCEGQANTSVKTEIEKVEGEKCEVEEFQEVKYYEDDVGSVCKEHQQTHFLEDTMENHDVRDDERPKATLDKDKFQEEKHQNADVASVCAEHQQTDFLEDSMEQPDVEESQMGVMLDQHKELREETSNQVDSDYVDEEHDMHSTENQLKKPKVGQPEVDGVALHKEKESQEDEIDQLERGIVCEGHSKPSVKTGMEKVEGDKPMVAPHNECQEEKHQKADVGSDCEEHQTHFLQDAMEKSDVGEVEKPRVTLDKEASQEEKQPEATVGFVCEKQQETHFLEDAMEKSDVGKAEVTLDKAECQEEKHHEVNVGCVREEHQQTHFLEDAMEKPGVGEPQVGVMPDKHNELQEETSDQVDSDYACEEHPAKSMENEIEKLEVGESEKASTIAEKKECQEEHATTKFMENEMEQPKREEESVTLQEKKESPEEMLNLTDRGCVLKEHEMQSIENKLEKPEVAKSEVEDVALQTEKEMREDKFDQPSICERYAETCVDNKTEKLEDGKPMVAQDKEESKEEKHYQADDGSLCGENQQTDLDHAMEKPVIEQPQVDDVMGGPQVEGVKLDKDKEYLDDKPDQISKISGSRECPTSYSIKTEIEKDEEKAIALGEEKQFPEEHTTKSVENETEQPKPEVEGATLDEKKEGPKEIQDQIDRGYEDEEREVHSEENELEKPELGEAGIESAVINKRKYSQEDKSDQIERGTVLKEDAKDSIELETEKLDIDLNSTALDKDECEEEKHYQADDGSVYEARQATDFLEKALEKPNVGALNKEEFKEEENHHQADNGSVYEHQVRDFLENAPEKPYVGKPQVEGIILDKEQELQRDIPNQVDSDSVSQKDQISSIKHEIEKLDMGESEKAIKIKEEKDFQKEHTAKYLDNEMEKPKPEIGTATLEEKKESPEEVPDHIDHGHAHQDDNQMNSMENELEKMEEGEPAVETSAVHKKKECQEQESNQLEKGSMCEEDTKKSIESETEMLEVTEPDGNSTTFKEECEEEEQDQADGGSVCEKHRVTDFLEHAMEKPDVRQQVENEKPEVNNSALDKEESTEGKNDQGDGGSACELTDFLKHAMEKPDVEEPQVEGATLDNDQELPEEKLDQIDKHSASEGSTERAFERKTEKLQVEESEAPIALHDEKEYSGHLCQPTVFDEQSMRSAENTKQQLEVKEPAVESAPLEKREREERQEETRYQIESDSVCNEQEAKSVKVSEMETPELEDVALYQKNESKGGEAKVRGTSSDEQVIRDSVEKDLERLEEVDAQVGPTLQGKVESHPDHAGSVCEEQAVNPVSGEFELVELEKPDERVVPHKMECQECIALHQENESKEGKADEVSHFSPDAQFITDSVEKGSEKLEGDEGHAAVLALKEIEDCQPDHTSSVCEEQAPEYVARELKLVELEEPEAADTPDKMGSEEKEPGQVHSSSLCEGETRNLMQNELEKPEMVEPKVGGVKLDEENLGENCYQNTTSFLKGETEKLELELEKAGAAFETVDCEKEPNQLHIEHVTKEHDIISLENEMEKLEVSDPKGSVKLEGESDYPGEKPADVKKVSQAQEQTTSSSESEMEKLEVEDPEVTLGENTECQDGKPGQLNPVSVCEEPEVGEQKVEIAALQKEREFQEENPCQVEREPEVGGVMLDEIKGCHKDKPNQIDSHSECEQHQAVSVEHEMETLEVGKPREGCPEKDECQGEDSGQLNSDFAHEERVINIAETEKGKLEMGGLEIGAVLLNNIESQNEKLDRVCDSSECEQYTTRSAEDIEKLEVENSEFEDEKPGSGYEEKTTAFMENDTQKSEVRETESQVIKLEKKECQSEKTDQIMGSSVSEEKATDLERDMDKPLISQPELGGIVALDERKECQEEVTNAIDNRSACETEKPEEDVLTLEENEESQGGGKPKQVDENRCVSEAQTVESVENERKKQEKEKPEVREPEIEDVPDEMKHQSEAPNQPSSQSACEELATNSPEENINKLEVDHSEAEKPDQVFDRSATEEHTSDCAENETENPEMRVSEMGDNILQQNEGQSAKPDQARSDCVCEEHANDSKDDTDKLEVKQPEVSMLLSTRSVSTAHSDSVENETKKTEVELPEVEVNVLDEKECCSDKPNPSEHPSVCEEHMSDSGEDHLDELEVNQSMVEKPQEIIASTTSESEAHTLNSLKNGTEKSHVRALEVEDNVLNENPDQDESSSECAATYQETEVGKLEMLEVEDNMLDENPDQDESSSEHATAYQLPKVGKLEMHQPQSHEMVKSSTYVHEAYMLDPLQNGMEKTEEVAPEVEDNVLDHKECLGDKPFQDESTCVREVHATDSIEEDMDDLEVNLPEVGKVGTLDQVISGSISVIEAHTVDSLGTETERVDERVLEVKDNVLEIKECLGEKLDQDKSSSVHDEHAADSNEDEGKPEVNQRDIEEPDLASVTDTVESLGNGTEKPEEGVPGLEGNVLEQKEYLDEKPDKDESSSATSSKEDEVEKPEEAVPNVEHNALEQKECFNEKPDQDAISSVFEEHATHYKDDGIDKLEVNQPKVKEPDQVFASSRSENETHTLDSLGNETTKAEERVLEVEDNKECLGKESKQDENSSVSEEPASYSKEDDMDKLEVNQQDIGMPHQVIAGGVCVSETHLLDSLENETKKPEEGMPVVKDNAAALKECIGDKPEQDANSSVCQTHIVDSQDNKTAKNEERMREVEDNVLEEKVGEKSNQVESSSVWEEHATSFTEESVDNLEVNQPEPHQNNALEKDECLDKKPSEPHQKYVLEGKDCLAENQDQDESSSVFEKHYTNSKEADMDEVQETPETDQAIYGDTSLCEHTLNSVENGTQEPEVGLPEVEDDRLASRTLCVSQETTSLSEDDYLKPKNEEHAGQPVNFPVTLSLENREDNSDLLSMTQDVLQPSQHEFSTEENVQEVDLSDIPAEGKQVKEFQQAPGNGENVYEQLLTVIDQETNRVSEHDPLSREEECNMEVKDFPGISKSEIEEIEIRQIIEMGADAPKPQEGTQEIPQQLDTAKPEEARQETMYHLQSWVEDQEVPLIQEPVLSKAKVNTAIPLENIYVSHEENTVNLSTDCQEVETKEIRTQIDKQTSQCQGVNNLPTLALAELQAQEAIPGDEGLVLSTIQSSHSDVKEMLLDIKECKDGARDQQSPQSVLEQQESPAGDEKSYGIQELAATRYQVDNPELLSGKDVETQDPDQINSNEVAATQYKADNPELLSDRDVETQDTDQTNLVDKQSGQKMACKDVAALSMHEEQPNFTLNELGKELATKKDDYHPKRTKMIQEIFGESNQNFCDAESISEKSESQTAANKQFEVVQIPDGDIESKLQPIQNSPELNLQEIHTQKSQTLSDNEQTKLTSIDDVKGDFQTVKEISATPEEQQGDLHLEETAPFHIHGIAMFETNTEPAKQELVSLLDVNKTQGHSVDIASPQNSFDIEFSQLVPKEKENEQMGSKSDVCPCMQLNQLNEVKQQHEEQTPESLDVEADNATDKESACDQNILILSIEEIKPEDRQQKQIDEAFESLPIPVTTSLTPSTLLPLPL